MDQRPILLAMAALEAAISATEKARAEEDKFVPELNRTFSAIAPTRWTSQIESSLDQPERLAATSAEIDSLMISFNSAFLAYRNVNQAYLSSGITLNDRIRDLVALIDSPESAWLDRDIRSAAQGLVLRAIEVHQFRRTDIVTGVDAYDIDARVYERVRSAFQTLAVQLAQPNHTYVRESSGFSAGSGKHFQSVKFVPFSDDVAAKLPHCARLTEAHSAYVLALNTVDRAVWKMFHIRIERDSEQRHAMRLVDIAHDPQSHGGIARIKSMVEAQNKQRVACETARAQILVALMELKVRCTDLLAALIAASAEVTALLAEIDAERRYSITERKNSARIAMNNCLAADGCLRSVHEMDYERHRHDLTNGNGVTALLAAYEKSAKRYRARKSF